MKRNLLILFLLFAMIIGIPSVKAETKKYYYAETNLAEDESQKVYYLLELNENKTATFSKILSENKGYYGKFNIVNNTLTIDVTAELGSDICAYKITKSITFQIENNNLLYNDDNIITLKNTTLEELEKKNIKFNKIDNHIFCQELINNLNNIGYYQTNTNSKDKIELQLYENMDAYLKMNDTYYKGTYELDSNEIVFHAKQKEINDVVTTINEIIPFKLIKNVFQRIQKQDNFIYFNHYLFIINNHILIKI